MMSKKIEEIEELKSEIERLKSENLQLSLTQDKEATKVMVEHWAKNEETKQETLKTIMSQEISEESLRQTAVPLTRGEKKKLKKEGLNIKEFDFAGDLDEYIDAMVEIKSVKNSDDMKEHELGFWVIQIIHRTLNPLEYEGNDS